jgi:hypothetical protein
MILVSLLTRPPSKATLERYFPGGGARKEIGGPVEMRR